MAGDTSDPAGEPSEKQPKLARAGMKETNTTMAREIDENLRRVYSATLNEDVPDRFAQLLARLRDKESRP